MVLSICLCSTYFDLLHYQYSGNRSTFYKHCHNVSNFSSACYKLRRRKWSELLAILKIYLYLRNKETQQTLQVIVSIHYDASFSCKRYLSIGAVCVRHAPVTHTLTDSADDT